MLLERDLSDQGLMRGDVGTVLVHESGRGYETEFVALDGETVAVATVAASEVRAIRGGEIAHARALVRDRRGR